MIVDDEHLMSALDRIARTPDGQMLYLFLQKTMASFPADPGAADALPTHDGRRRFAHDLMVIMAKGIRDSHGGRDPTDSPIVFNPREPVAFADRGSVRDRIRRSDPELASLAGPGSGPKPAA